MSDKTTDKEKTVGDDDQLFAEYQEGRGLIHIVHEDGENYIDPDRIIEAGEAMGEYDGEDRLITYLMVDGIDDQLDLPGIELEPLVDVWAQARMDVADDDEEA